MPTKGGESPKATKATARTPTRDGRRRGGRRERRRERRRRRIRGTGRVVGVLGLVLVAVLSLTDIGPGPSDEPTPSPSSNGSPTTTLVPTDIEEPRETIDLADLPGAEATPDDVARWWAATYIAYVGHELPDSLAARLEPVTAPTLLDEVRSQPPAASYDEAPVAIEGVSNRLPLDNGDGTTQVRVTVETAGAVVVYDLTLAQAPGSPPWRVDAAVRL